MIIPTRSGWACTSSKKPVPEGADEMAEKGDVSITGGMVETGTVEVTVGTGVAVTEGMADV
jgi:hypothetical protein